MEFLVLGPVELAEGGRPVELGGSRQRTLLAALLVDAGHVVHTDRLIDVLWGAEPPGGARGSLHSYVSRLRKRLAESGEDEILETRRDGYLLKVHSGQFDARRFEDLVAEARASARPEDTAELLDRALSLWRGAAYADVAHEDFVRPEVTRLEELRCSAVEDRIEALHALGRHRETVAELEAATTANPFRDRIHALLALALYRSGRQTDALAVLRRLKERLVEELGVDASPAMQELERDILRHAPGVQALGTEEGRVTGGLRREPPPEPPRTSFIGRQSAVESVAGLLRQHALVTLTGTGGVGKTRLAEETAAHMATDDSEGVACCRLAPVRDLHAVASAVADAVGIRQLGSANVEDALLATLESQQLLLIVDNCEHLLPAIAPLLDRLVRRCKNVQLLATSRERLCVDGERVWEVPPLDVPPEISDLHTLASNPSIRLFCDRARAVDPGFRLDLADSEAVSELCRRLDGVPLAIELAAARVAALPPAAMTSRLDRRFSVLTDGPRSEGERHRTLRAVVDWSYRLLSEDEKVLFHRLSVFAGDFSLEAAETVCSGGVLDSGDIAGLLAGLIDKSMVVVERAEDVVRYRVLETLREYGAALLAERRESDQIRRAHASYYSRIAEKDAPGLRGRDDARFVSDIEREYDNLRAAVSAALEAGDADDALRIPVALYGFALPGLRDEVFTWARRAVDRSGTEDHPLYATACACAAQGLVNRGQSAEAYSYLDRAAEAAEKDDHLAQLHVWDVLGVIALYEGRLDDCLAITREVIDVATRTGHHYFSAWARIREVLAHTYRGDVDAALEGVHRLRAESAAGGSPNIRTWTSYVHGEALLEVEPSQAEVLLQQAVGDARRTDNRFAEGVALVSLASLHGRLGKREAALSSFREVIIHWRRLGNWSQQWTTLRNLVELLVRFEFDEAATVLLGAVSTAEVTRPTFGIEAQRLAEATRVVEKRLGADAASTARDRGKDMTAGEMVEYALAQIDHALQVTR